MNDISNNYSISLLKKDLYNNLIDEEYYNKIFYLLSQLTDSPSIRYNNFINIISNLNNNHFIFVYKKNNIPLALITLFIEQKLIHGGKCVAHIEDLIVDHEYRNAKIGSKLINHCINLSKEYKCYKIILNCKDELIEYYKKYNFVKYGNSMRYNIDLS